VLGDGDDAGVLLAGLACTAATCAPPAGWRDGPAEPAWAADAAVLGRGDGAARLAGWPT
jgi:hypothetical protein